MTRVLLGEGDLFSESSKECFEFSLAHSDFLGRELVELGTGKDLDPLSYVCAEMPGTALQH